ncbi:PREDICTED: plasma membrane-associated cation-binding protein 1-like [Ipomoea nil]|uniref:plasma membrane-associated cation-binding protein 1-like n=1 Tax=Ipomoea nil TaxID=35883 RepID=UPI000901F224|nr:PREDICTED: plasma membrane-associated cation-binding protein 1-like [Ipomoea nil]XP_019169999.1 PREDICTED: plasma membrane-associated cation-binding protein 1-like [Ipomoea nil]
MNYWKDKVLPKIKKVFDKNGPKKAAAAEACKAFDDSKEQYGKEFEDKKTELQPKVIEVYEACSAEIKGLVKEPKDSGLKKHSAAVQKLLDELVKIDFPGSKAVSEACTKLGPAYVSGPVLFIFEKVSVLIPVEEKKEEEAAPAPAEAKEETSREVEVKAEEIAAAAEEEPKAAEAPPAAKAAPATETPAAAVAAAEPPKAEEKPEPAAEPPKA